MAIRSAGFTLPRYTTVQITALVTQYGPTGTVEVNGLQPGNMVYDTTANVVKVFNGTAFLTVTAA